MNQSQETHSPHVPSSGETSLQELSRNAEPNRALKSEPLEIFDTVRSKERARHLAKKREQARIFRARKKIMIERLRESVGSLSKENLDLKFQNEALKNKVCALEE